MVVYRGDFPLCMAVYTGDFPLYVSVHILLVWDFDIP